MKYILSQTELQNQLAITDLTNQNHAIALMANEIINGLITRNYPIPSSLKGNPIVSLEENYALLGYSENEATLGEDHTRWVSENTLLRTQTTALIPNWIKKAANENLPQMSVAAGMTWRRDSRDRLHCANPHQMDVWLLDNKALAHKDNLIKLVMDILDSALPNLNPKDVIINNSPHHYTEQGIEVNIKAPWGEIIEVLECGIIAKSLLQRLNVQNKNIGGLALGMGLDRLVMLRKNIKDIRILRHQDNRIIKQMSNLEEYKEVSMQPAAKRDISIAINNELSEEDITEIILNGIAEKAPLVEEEIKIIKRWTYDELPEIARKRLGMNSKQHNILIHLELRDYGKTLTSTEANEIYSIIQKVIHQGTENSGYLII